MPNQPAAAVEQLSAGCAPIWGSLHIAAFEILLAYSALGLPPALGMGGLACLLIASTHSELQRPKYPTCGAQDVCQLGNCLFKLDTSHAPDAAVGSRW